MSQNVPPRNTSNATGSSTAELAEPSPTERVVRGPREQQHHEMPGHSRRNSIEPPQMFAEDQHVGPTAGISFLYHPWNKGEERTSRVPLEPHGTADAPSLVPLDCYGDFPQSILQQPESPYPTHLSPDQISVTLERYFRFATPTYRYMHRPTLEKWANRYVNDDPKLGNAQRACVLLALAQSLLYTVRSDGYVTEDNENIRQSRLCYQKAKDLLDRETGPPSLASVQARLAMCLYMLSTFRMTACRFCFSVTATILTSLGLHRVHSTKSERVMVDNVESELRRLAFWCAYVLDGYLSVMLGRPRILRDEDVDQPYPRNVDDSDLMSTEPIDDLPQHGNLEAFLAHASLARLMARSSDVLYPLQPLTEEQVLQRSNELLDILESWQQSLPNYLKAGNKTLTGERMFERQNTVLKLAHAHMRILITRRCLLLDTSRLGHLVHAQLPPDLKTIRPIEDCVAGITTILDSVTMLMDRDSLYHCFWFTQYIALVAASTLYIFLIQGARQALPAPMDSFIDAELYFGKAKRCQNRLDCLAPPGSQAKRHHQLLHHLRCQVERDLAKIRRSVPAPTVNPTLASERGTQPSVGSAHAQRHNTGQINHPYNVTGPEAAVPFAQHPYRPHLPQIDVPHAAIPGEDFSDRAMFAPVDSASETDLSIANMLDLGWASLDTIGFMMPDVSRDFADEYQ